MRAFELAKLQVVCSKLSLINQKGVSFYDTLMMYVIFISNKFYENFQIGDNAL